MPQTVLVAGVSRHLGGAFARRLSRDESIDRIIGVDVVPPRHGIGRAEFMRADIRSPLISRIISGNDVDTVVHMGVIATPRAGGGPGQEMPAVVPCGSGPPPARGYGGGLV